MANLQMVDSANTLVIISGEKSCKTNFPLWLSVHDGQAEGTDLRLTQEQAEQLKQFLTEHF
jgi:hypothetical protein